MVKYYTLLFTEVNIWVYDTVYVHFVFLLLGCRAEEPIHQASTEIFPTYGLDTDSAGFPRSKLGTKMYHSRNRLNVSWWFTLSRP